MLEAVMVALVDTKQSCETTTKAFIVVHLNLVKMVRLQDTK